MDRQILNSALSSLSMSDLAKALLSTVNDGILVTDPNGHILFENAAMKKINSNVRIPPDPTERVLQFSWSDSGDKSLKLNDLPAFRALNEGEVRDLELTLHTKSGDCRTLVCNSKALYGNSGEKVGAVAIFHDTTAEHAVRSQKLKLEEEQIELLRINSELERFSSIAAHDLKSPLNSITQFVQLLREELEGKLDSDQAELLNYISSAGDRLRILIDDLLAYARAGTKSKTFEVVDLNELTQTALVALKGQIDHLKAEIKVEPLPRVFGDKLGLSQLLQNLISNALKYRSEAPPAIRVSSSLEKDEWHFVVSDNGVGIEQDEQRAVFELFKRASGSSKTEGTGLGLPICKRIVESHCGNIWAESQPGHGTSIHFTIPYSERVPC